MNSADVVPDQQAQQPEHEDSEHDESPVVVPPESMAPLVGREVAEEPCVAEERLDNDVELASPGPPGLVCDALATTSRQEPADSLETTGATLIKQTSKASSHASANLVKQPSKASSHASTHASMPNRQAGLANSQPSQANSQPSHASKPREPSDLSHRSKASSKASKGSFQASQATGQASGHDMNGHDDALGEASQDTEELGDNAPPLEGQGFGTTAAFVPPPSMNGPRPRPSPALGTQGLRGPRPPPSLGAQGTSLVQQGASPDQQSKCPLGDLITWLDGTDVGDVLDQLSLNELLQTPKASGVASKGYTNRGVPQRDPGVGESAARQESKETKQTGDGDDDDDDDDDDVQSGDGESQDDEDDLEDVGSDMEAPPRPPPLAPSAAPLMRPMSPENSPRGQTLGQQRNPGKSLNAPGVNNNNQDEEEEEWFARQKLTGAIGRLVYYCEFEVSPKDDILGFRRTRRGRTMVTGVRENGTAAKCGVMAGDELVSIDGRKEFVGHPPHVVHASLRAPVTLVFLGFVGRIQAEVRVKRPPEPKCGLDPGADIVVNEMDKQPLPLELCDAVVFRAPNDDAVNEGDAGSSLLMTTAGNMEIQEAPPPFKEEPPKVEQAPDDEGTDPKSALYELQREDARNLIVNALGKTATF